MTAAVPTGFSRHRTAYTVYQDNACARGVAPGTAGRQVGQDMTEPAHTVAEAADGGRQRVHRHYRYSGTSRRHVADGLCSQRKAGDDTRGAYRGYQPGGCTPGAACRSICHVVAPWQIAMAPVMVAGAACTVSVVVAAQPAGRVYTISAVPADTPVTTPAGVTVAIADAPDCLLQVPPPVPSDSAEG